jgi:hypothetical protein
MSGGLTRPARLAFGAVRRLLASVLAIGLLCVGAGASALGAYTHPLHVTVHADADAPSGALPKVSFVVTGVVPALRYFIAWRLNPGPTTSVRCSGIGNTHTVRATTKSVTLGPSPGGSYGSSHYRGLCPGRSYHGQIYSDQGGGSHEADTFTFRAPAAVP